MKTLKQLIIETLKIELAQITNENPLAEVLAKYPDIPVKDFAPEMYEKLILDLKQRPIPQLEQLQAKIAEERANNPIKDEKNTVSETTREPLPDFSCLMREAKSAESDRGDSKGDEKKNPIVEVMAITLDLKVDKNGKVIILELGDLTSNHNNYTEVFPGKNLKLLAVEDLLNHYETIYLLDNGHTRNCKELIDYYKKNPNPRIVICESFAELKDKLQNKIVKNSLVISLDHFNTDCLNNYLVEHKIETQILNRNELIYNCVGNKGLFYRVIKDRIGNSVSIPQTFLVTNKQEVEKALTEIKADTVFLKPSAGTEGDGAFPLKKDDVQNVLAIIFNGIANNSSKDHIVRSLELLNYSAKLKDKIGQLYENIRALAQRGGMPVIVLQEFIQSELLDGYDYIGKALYNVYVRANGNVEPKLIGLYKEVPYVKRKVNDIPTVENTITDIPQAFLENETSNVNQQLVASLKSFVQYASKTSMYDYVNTYSSETVFCSRLANDFEYDCNQLDYLKKSSLTSIDLIILNKHFKHMMFIYIRTNDAIVFKTEIIRAFAENILKPELNKVAYDYLDSFYWLEWNPVYLRDGFIDTFKKCLASSPDSQTAIMELCDLIDKIKCPPVVAKEEVLPPRVLTPG